MRLSCDQLLHKRNMSVINMRVRDDMNQFSYLHAAHLCQHMDQNRILADIPVVCGQDILGTLV